MESRSFRVHAMLTLLGFFDDDAVLAVVLAQPYRHRLPPRGGQVLADEVGTDGELSMTAVDQDRQLDHRGPAEIDDSVQGGPDGTAREKHVIDEDDGLALDAERNVGPSDDGGAAQIEVVPVERDVEGADRQACPVDGGDLPGQPPGDGDPSRPETDEGQVAGAGVALEDLVGDAGESPVEGGFVENLRLLAQAWRRAGHDLSLRASRGSLKGKGKRIDCHSTCRRFRLSTAPDAPEPPVAGR